MLLWHSFHRMAAFSRSLLGYLLLDMNTVCLSGEPACQTAIPSHLDRAQDVCMVRSLMVTHLGTKMDSSACASMGSMQ